MEQLQREIAGIAAHQTTIASNQAAMSASISALVQRFDDQRADTMRWYQENINEAREQRSLLHVLAVEQKRVTVIVDRHDTELIALKGSLHIGDIRWYLLCVMGGISGTLGILKIMGKL